MAYTHENDDQYIAVFKRSSTSMAKGCHNGLPEAD